MSVETHEADKQASTLPRSVWVMSWISFFADVSSEMVYPIIPLFMVQVLGASRTELGLMEGAAVLLVALMSAYAGFRSDRPGQGRVKWIRIGYGMPVIGKTIMAMANVWPLVAGGRLFDRFGKGLRGAPRDALIADAVTRTSGGGRSDCTEPSTQLGLCSAYCSRRCCCGGSPRLPA